MVSRCGGQLFRLETGDIGGLCVSAGGHRRGSRTHCRTATGLAKKTECGFPSFCNSMVLKPQSHAGRVVPHLPPPMCPGLPSRPPGGGRCRLQWGGGGREAGGGGGEVVGRARGHSAPASLTLLAGLLPRERPETRLRCHRPVRGPGVHMYIDVPCPQISANPGSTRVTRDEHPGSRS